MAPHLHVSAGPSVSELKTVYVNKDRAATTISSDAFHGRVAVRIKHFTGDVPEGEERVSEAPYFDGGHGTGMTWSIQVQGRFLKEVTTDDLVFGNQFEHSIKERLPYGTSAALHAARFIDPNLEHDLYSDKPWAFSPLVSTMTRIHAARLTETPPSGDAAADFDVSGWPSFFSPENDSGPAYVPDDVTALFPDDSDPKRADIDLDDGTYLDLKGGDAEEESSGAPQAHKARAKWFGDKAHRQSVTITPQNVLTADFCNGFIDFNTLRLEIPYTAGMGFDLKKYWDGQPVTYYCKDKSDETVFFVVQFNIVDLDK